MKKTLNGVGYNKSRARMVLKKKAAQTEEARLAARKNTVVKAIAIGSAAVGVLALGLFAAKTLKKKKKGFFS